MTIFVRAGITAGYPAVGPLRVNLWNMEFSVSCQWTFWHENNQISIFYAILRKNND